MERLFNLLWAPLYENQINLYSQLLYFRKVTHYFLKKIQRSFVWAGFWNKFSFNNVTWYPDHAPKGKILLKAQFPLHENPQLRLLCNMLCKYRELYQQSQSRIGIFGKLNGKCVPNENHLPFLKFNSMNSISRSPGNLCLFKSLLGMNFFSRISRAVDKFYQLRSIATIYYMWNNNNTVTNIDKALPKTKVF